jgi:hypothetical protein
MKHALVKGQLVPATSDAPQTAICPHCGSPVKLRNRQGTHFWRHVQLPLSGCPPPSPESVGTSDDHDRWTRQVGDWIIELYPDPSGGSHPGGSHLKLRRLSAEGADEPSELTLPLEEVRPLAEALLDAAAELAAAGEAT